ncbi:MAG: hypothetical protein GEU83_04415 [Pseudonocardiaceae bacterium]|nr:hypothetical protein [Pseudonocardiaceae bacterium]
MADHTRERELAIAAALRETGDAAAPTGDEVDRMRSRVMAGAASVGRDSGGDGQVTPMPARGGTSRRGGRHAKRTSAVAEARGRMMATAAAALCLLMSLSGMSLLLSRDAVPGDALYAFKRSTESAELGMTFGDQSKALKHLEFATARIGEIEQLAAAADAGGTWGSGTAQLLAALDDFDADTIVGTRLLTGVAAFGDVGMLSSLDGWADLQQERLDDVRAALPADAGGRITSSAALLDEVQQRADALQDRAGCQSITSGASDSLGPLPAEDSCVPGELDDAASAEPLAPAPETAAPATPDGSTAAPSTTPTPEEQDSERPGLRDIVPNPDREDRLEDRLEDREDRPGWPERDDPPSDPRSPLLPLPLLPDMSAPPSSPDGPEPR